MARNSDRLLFILKTFMKETDENHQLSLRELMLLCDENGTPGTDKTIRKDLDQLISSGFKIMTFSDPGRPNYYYYKQAFLGSELKIIIDALSAAKFIKEEDSRDLIRKLITLANSHTTSMLQESDVSGHRDNPSLHMAINKITDAISKKKKIRYQYCDYDLKKNRILHNDGEKYIFSPYDLSWNQDHYYLLGQMDKRPGSINPVRVDLMCNIRILKDDILPAPADYQPEKYSDKVFSMFGGEEREVTLEADRTLLKSFIDRFGNDFDIPSATATKFFAVVHVCVSPTFFSWVFQFDGRVRIKGPADIARQYAEMLERNHAACNT